MKLTQAISKNNFRSLLWHAGFLSLAQNFIDIDTVIPAMMVDSGGTAMHIGILTAIMLGGSSFTQLIFAPFISNYSFKKKFLLLGINSRIFALLAISALLYYNSYLHGDYRILMIFVLISIFSLGGAFSNISYTDILGKSVDERSRKPFFSIRLVITGIILLGSVFLARFVLTADEYPINYAHMFFIGFIALAIASLGFWNLKEVVPSRLKVKSPAHFAHLIKTEIKENPKLGHFLGFINTMGISIGLLPFVVLYAKENFNTQSSDTADFLLFKVIGSVVMGLLLFAFARKFRYRNLLYLNVVFAFSIPLFLLLATINPPLGLVFFVGGLIFATYSITMNGVLLEVSGTTNRALYTGIAGAGNILPALFPLLGGWVIMQLGYQVFFIMYMATILSSLYFIYKLKCRH
ncbi:MAG: MFS transporter [Bacteroidetes bacterium]|nr:MAG: MFS transporter [Bacteroidota bacterium]